MKKKIVILGSTGSIGKSTLEVIKKDKKNFDVILLTANNNYKKLIQQAKQFKAKNVLIKNEKFFSKVKNSLKKNKSLFWRNFFKKNNFGQNRLHNVSDRRGCRITTNTRCNKN